MILPTNSLLFLSSASGARDSVRVEIVSPFEIGDKPRLGWAPSQLPLRLRA